MRTIKFRSFYNDKSMLYSDSYINLYFFFELKPENYPLMQFTGLQDKNGKEIYEGDILKSKYHTWIVLGLDFCEGFYGFTLKTTVMDKIYLADNSFQTSSEVIGNIYQNPELLSTPTAVL